MDTKTYHGIYFPIFTNDIWSYLLWSPVVASGHRFTLTRGCGGRGGGGGFTVSGEICANDVPGAVSGQGRLVLRADTYPKEDPLELQYSPLRFFGFVHPIYRLSAFSVSFCRFRQIVRLSVDSSIRPLRLSVTPHRFVCWSFPSMLVAILAHPFIRRSFSVALVSVSSDRSCTSVGTVCFVLFRFVCTVSSHGSFYPSV